MSELRTIMERGVGYATPAPPARRVRAHAPTWRSQAPEPAHHGGRGRVRGLRAAIWVVTSGGPSDGALTPGDGGIVTEPTDQEATIPQGAASAGLIGLPPEEATPSTPTRGELVLRFGSTHGMSDLERFNASVFADGRLIWTRLTEPMPGLIEQRLTPEGVELIRSAFLSTGLFDHNRNLAAVHGLELGGIQVRDGDRLVSVSWVNGAIPPRPTNPRSGRPPSRRVPSNISTC